MISFDDFAKVDLRVGRVLESETVPESTKLVKLLVDLGEDRPRTIFTVLLQWYEPEWFRDKLFVFAANLEPKKIMNIESQAMLLAVEGGDGTPHPLLVPEGSNPGDKIR